MTFISMFKNLNECSGYTSSLYDVASGGRSVEVLLYYDPNARPLHGLVVLMRSHIIITQGMSGKVLFGVAFQAIKGMRSTECVLLPGKSFDCLTEQSESTFYGEEFLISTTVARKIISLDIFTNNAAISIKMLSSEGEQFSRAALFVWRLNYGELNLLSIPVLHNGDIIYALAGAPVRLPAIMIQHISIIDMNPYENKLAVDIFMLNEKELCITRKPLDNGKFWHNMSSGESEEVVRLSLDNLCLLSFPSSTTMKLVGCHGDVWLFEISDPTTDFTVQHAIRRLIDLFLLGSLASLNRFKDMESSCALRYFDLNALYLQYCSIDSTGVGYILSSDLESAIGPLISCDSRIVQAITCFDKYVDKDAVCDNNKIRLNMFLDHMHTLLEGSITERATISFRAFGGRTKGVNQNSINSEKIGFEEKEKEDIESEEECHVRSSDFQLIARDILLGFRFKSSKENETIDDVINTILQLANNNRDQILTSMSFPIFLRAYKLLLQRLESFDKSLNVYSASVVGGTPPPLLSFGSPHWLPLTYLMAGIEATALDTPTVLDFASKDVVDLSQGPPSMLGLREVPRIGAASNFLRRRLPTFHRPPRVTLTAYACGVFSELRRLSSAGGASLLISSLGLGALRGGLLLGRLSAPRDLRSSGRSGALLLGSRDGAVVVKRVALPESRTLRRLLPAYTLHLQQHTSTLLPRYTGLYALWLSGEKSAFVIAENVFAHAKLPIAVVYDLKGSTVHRTTAVEDRRHGAAGKDNDFLSDKKKLRLSSETREALLAQLEVDTLLLEQANTLDYSLLVGIHTSNNTFTTSKETMDLSIKQKEMMRKLVTNLSEEKKYDDNSLNKLNKNMKANNNKFNDSISNDNNNNNNNVFSAFYGGVASSDCSEVYYFGLVDCLTAYNLKKVGEHYGKSMLMKDMKEVSCVPPPDYRSRFMAFMQSIIEE